MILRTIFDQSREPNDEDPSHQRDLSDRITLTNSVSFSLWGLLGMSLSVISSIGGSGLLLLVIQQKILSLALLDFGEFGVKSTNIQFRNILL